MMYLRNSEEENDSGRAGRRVEAGLKSDWQGRVLFEKKSGDGKGKRHKEGVCRSKLVGKRLDVC